MSYYLYKTTDDTATITIPDPPALPPTPDDGGAGGGGGYPPSRPSPPPPATEGEPVSTLIEVDEDGDGKIDCVIVCNNSGCSAYPV